MEGKHPRAPTVRLLSRDERATPAVLQFLRDTKVGRVVTLAPRGGDEEWEELEEIELWPELGRARKFVATKGHPRMYLCSLFLPILSEALGGEVIGTPY